MESYGKKLWIIGDGFISSQSVKAVSHESVCVINGGNEDADIMIEMFFEDREPIIYKSFCKARRTHHIRLDKIKDTAGNLVPRDVPYAMAVKSNVNVVVQHTRLDTSLGNMALMTAIAYPAE